MGMTQEDVIKGLECLAKQHGIVGVCEPENCPYGDLHTCTNEIARDALALLKAQEPVKPRVAHDGWYRCGNCNCSLASGERVKHFYGHPWPNYCEECGKAVKW